MGQNSKFTSIADWQSRESSLNKANITFVSPNEDLIDLIWVNNRPEKPNSELIIHEPQFTGKNFADKLKQVQEKLKANNADVFVVTALDEVACIYFCIISLIKKLKTIFRL